MRGRCLTPAARDEAEDPRKLTSADDRASFHSGERELDEWLQKYSWQDQRARHATTYVTTVGDNRVVGYYAITVAGYEQDAAPGLIAKGTQRSALFPYWHASPLTESGTGEDWVGASSGRNAAGAAALESVAAPALLVHARDDEARTFTVIMPSSSSLPWTRFISSLPLKAIASRLDLHDVTVQLYSRYPARLARNWAAARPNQPAAARVDRR